MCLSHFYARAIFTTSSMMIVPCCCPRLHTRPWIDVACDGVGDQIPEWRSHIHATGRYYNTTYDSRKQFPTHSLTYSPMVDSADVSEVSRQILQHCNILETWKVVKSRCWLIVQTRVSSARPTAAATTTAVQSSCRTCDVCCCCCFVNAGGFWKFSPISI